MVLSVTAVFGTPVRENSQKRNTVILKERNRLVVQHISSNECILPVIEFDHRNLSYTLNFPVFLVIVWHDYSVLNASGPISLSPTN